MLRRGIVRRKVQAASTRSLGCRDPAEKHRARPDPLDVGGAETLRRGYLLAGAPKKFTGIDYAQD
jgi:hypothetical protein